MEGRAEVVCKTADGTMDGQGNVIGDPTANWVQPEDGTAKVVMATRDGAKTLRTVNTFGHILSGPEYLTVFDGLTGAALATTNYVPARVAGATEFKPQELYDTWGDASGNRSDRYLACVAYLDGEHPSVVMCRGYYTRTTLAAWDWRDGRLSRRWLFDSDTFGPADRPNPFRGQGNHNLSVADVDGDGKDEIVYGAMVIDDNGTPLYSTGWGHGDALHVSDLVPDNPGLEVFDIQERFDAQGMSLRDARSGAPIFTIPSVKAATSGGDAGEGPGRGVAFNIDPRYPGAETWAAGAGILVSTAPAANGSLIAARAPAISQSGGMAICCGNCSIRTGFRNGTGKPALRPRSSSHRARRPTMARRPPRPSARTFSAIGERRSFGEPRTAGNCGFTPRPCPPRTACRR